MQADGAVIFTTFLRKAWPKRSAQEQLAHGTTESLLEDEAEFEYPMPEECQLALEEKRLSSIM